MKYEIELPDELQFGLVRYEPTGEFRNVSDGEVFLNYSGMCERAHHDLGFPRIILRPVWTWPEWLGGWGIAKDKDGGTWWYSSECYSNGNEWLEKDQRNGVMVAIENFQNFTPPTITDWTKPTLNPHWKGSADAR